MTSLKDKVQNVLDESRILILLAQVVLGFQLRAPFEPGFAQLPPVVQKIKLAGLFLLLITFALLITPASYHRIVEDGEDTRDIHQFTSGLLELALLPFALAFAIDLYVAAEKAIGRAFGIGFGLAACGVALFFWYGIEKMKRAKNQSSSRQSAAAETPQEEAAKSKLKDKIKHVLTEARMVLPGAQALLGFQLAIIMLESFERLPVALKYVHIASLAMIACSVILLMTPATYHRLVEDGNNTTRFHRVASRLVLMAMIPLALGMLGDLFLVVKLISGSNTLAAISAFVMLLLFGGLWFALPYYVKAQQTKRRST